MCCTGAGTDVAAAAGPLVRGLLTAGHASADPLGLGLRATPDGALRDRAGRSDERVWVLGPLRRGELWETTAVPELRGQAAGVARAVCASLAARVRASRLSTRHNDRVRISAKVDYAMRALVELAATGAGSPITAERLAEAQGIPQKFLQNILLELRRAGIVASHRGPDGGHALARPATASPSRT